MGGGKTHLDYEGENYLIPLDIFDLYELLSNGKTPREIMRVHGGIYYGKIKKLKADYRLTYRSQDSESHPERAY